MKNQRIIERRFQEGDWFVGLAERAQRMHPDLFTVAVAGFERQLILSMHLAYTSYVLRGLLTNDVTNGGNTDARLCAAITALKFVSLAERKGKRFAELCEAWSDHVHYPPEFWKRKRERAQSSFKGRRNKKGLRYVRVR